MENSSTCRVCKETKLDSSFVTIKGKRVGLVCRKCRNIQIIATRNNQDTIAANKAKKLLLESDGKAECTKCGSVKLNELFPQQFGKRWGMVCSECTKGFKKEWFAVSPRGLEIKARADKLAEKRAKAEAAKAARIAARTAALVIDGRSTCNTCGVEKPNTEYFNNGSKRVGRRCKECTAKATQENSRKRFENNPEVFRAGRTHEAGRRRAQFAKRIPAWADMAAIKEIYLNRPDGYHVDHVIPLFGKQVSGLHIETNLQYLPAMENMKKNRAYDVMAQFN